ncbi:MAG: LysM peptidoglycan-binding domain-containing protein [Candidatus Eremiobacteraeota bacterium]|nr:LysM peptidoglycan-binding domain-containing protein [Candidatus Eremiobacteraeota bacterium]
MKPETAEPDEYFLVGQDDSRLNIYLRYQLFKALEDFAKRESHREQVGLLVGREATNSEGESFILVEDAIEAPLGDENTGRFEEGMWKRARRIAAARHPNRTVVGWFHTHLDSSLDPTEEERTVHKRHFPEESHLLYVVSARADDRNFYMPIEGQLTAAEGFRIYGKTPASAHDEAVPVGARAGMNAVGANPEQQSRHLERKLDKIQTRLQSPPVTPKDILIVVLLVINACLILFRPNPPVTVDTSALERGQSDLSAQVTALRGRIDKLERHISDIKMLDEQLKLAAGLEEIDEPLDLPDDEPKPEKTKAPAQTPAQAAADMNALSGGSGVIKLYKVAAGDTLGALVDKFYPNSPNGTTTAFADFNRLNAPDYAIFPGDTLKVPNLQALRN